MSGRLARGVAAAALVACLGAFIAGGLFISASRGRVPSGSIVVIGDLAAPGMQEVVDELERRVRLGDDLTGSGESGGTVAIVLFVVLLLTWVGIGTLIVFRQPANWAGWLLILTGAPFPLLSLAQAVMVYGLKVEPGSIPLISAWATLGEYALYPTAMVPLLFLLYPDGHLPGRRWRWTVVGLLGGTAVALLGFLFRPGPFNNWRDDGIVFENPLGIDAFASVAGVTIGVGSIVAVWSALSAVVAIVLRYRRSTGEERQQMRLLAFVGALAGSFIVLMFVFGLWLSSSARTDETKSPRSSPSCSASLPSRSRSACRSPISWRSSATACGTWTS